MTQNTESPGHHGGVLWRYDGQTGSSEFSAVWAYTPYPGCPARGEDRKWRPSAPLMILTGEDDDWTPAPPCRDLAARFPDKITFIAYPGAYHDFDAPNRPVKLREGAASAAGGVAHVGTNEPARQDALARLPKWLEEIR